MDFYTRTTLPKRTIVFDTYWKFATVRQSIFFNRVEGGPFPWTDDPILQMYKFTNAYRASDRVSQFLINNVIYNKPWNFEDTFFRVLLFKTFNKISTWEYFEKRLGVISFKSFSVRSYISILDEIAQLKAPIYSGAYIMASGKSFFHQKRKYANHIMLIDSMMKGRLPLKLEAADTMKEIFDSLLSFPTIGSFLAYQYTIDLNYSEHLSFGENDFVKPGPGALSGIEKCFETTSSLNQEYIIQYMVDEQEKELQRLGLEFKTLWGRPLHLIDCQNLFCEVDKYARLAHPKIVSSQSRKRIKQQYKSPKKKIDYWFPPKWNINGKIERNE